MVMGAAEVLGLRLEDLDWQAGILRARRPKTKVRIELPLLPPVAKALTAYLRWERPPAKGTARLFLSKTNALRADNQWGDSAPHPALCNASRRFGESDRGSRFSTQPREQASRFRSESQGRQRDPGAPQLFFHIRLRSGGVEASS